MSFGVTVKARVEASAEGWPRSGTMPGHAFGVSMTDRNLRIAISVMVVLIVVVLLATAMVMGGRQTASASPTPGAPTDSGSIPPDASEGPDSSGEPTASPDASASPSPTPPPPSAPLATATVVNIRLDATDDADGSDRVVTFKSEGPGTIEVNLTSSSGQGSTHMCLLRGKNEVGCKDLASGTFTGQTSKETANWHVRLRGVGSATPIVKLKVTFQTTAPSVKIANARFDGTDYPETNGIEVRFKVRASGDARLAASWGDDFTYDIDLVDQTNGSGDVTVTDQGPANGVDQGWPVEAGVWRIILRNSEPGSGPVSLTATVSWP